MILEYSKKIKRSQYLIKKNKPCEPFINVNYAPWWILDLIPGISSSVAKQAVYRAKRGQKFNNFADFADFCSLDIKFINIVQKIVFF